MTESKQDDGTKYFEKAQIVLARVDEIKADKQKWAFVADKHDTLLFKKDYPKICSLPCYLTQTVFAKSRKELVDKIWVMDEDKAKKNDPKLTMWKEVEKGDGWKVCSQYSGMMWPIWPRHVVFAQVKIEEKGVTRLVAFSVDHKKAPVNAKTHVEAHVHMSVYEFVDNKDKTTTVSRYTHVDPMGGIPDWLVNMYATNQVDMFNRWKKD